MRTNAMVCPPHFTLGIQAHQETLNLGLWRMPGSRVHNIKQVPGPVSGFTSGYHIKQLLVQLRELFDIFRGLPRWDTGSCHHHATGTGTNKGNR